MNGDHETPKPELRISDADRDEVIQLLRAHTAAGRLTLGEFSDRAGVVVAARTRSELEPVTADLPALAPSSASRAASAGRWVVAFLGDAKKKGRWRLAPKTMVVAALGDVQLDLTSALFDGPEVTIDAVAIMGDVVIRVPVGMEVELSGTPLLGDHNLHIADGPTRPGLPRLRVRAVAVMGDVTVET